MKSDSGAQMMDIVALVEEFKKLDVNDPAAVEAFWQKTIKQAAIAGTVNRNRPDSPKEEKRGK